MSKIRVGVNGYGVIGKRLADAVRLQSDMQLIGISDIATDWRIKSVGGRMPLFVSTEDAFAAMNAQARRRSSPRWKASLTGLTGS